MKSRFGFVLLHVWKLGIRIFLDCFLIWGTHVKFWISVITPAIFGLFDWFVRRESFLHVIKRKFLGHRNGICSSHPHYGFFINSNQKTPSVLPSSKLNWSPAGKLICMFRSFYQPPSHKSENLFASSHDASDLTGDTLRDPVSRVGVNPGKGL